MRPIFDSYSRALIRDGQFGLCVGAARALQVVLPSAPAKRALACGCGRCGR